MIIKSDDLLNVHRNRENKLGREAQEWKTNSEPYLFIGRKEATRKAITRIKR